MIRYANPSAQAAPMPIAASIVAPAAPRLVQSIHPFVDLVARAAKIDRGDLLGRRRSARVAQLRFALFWVARHRLGWSMQRIGRAFGRDHSTVVHGLQRANQLRRDDPEFGALCTLLFKVRL